MKRAGAVMRGVDVRGLDIDAPWLADGALLINCVDVVPLVEAELNRRFPGRDLKQAKDPDGLRTAYGADSLAEMDEARTRLAAMMGVAREEVSFGPSTSANTYVLAQAARINFSTRLFNLIVTNVPGPQIPLYLLGRELEAVYPIAFLPENHALAIAIMSYNGGINFGLLADYDSMEDVNDIAEVAQRPDSTVSLEAGPGRFTYTSRHLHTRGGQAGERTREVTLEPSTITDSVISRATQCGGTP